MAKRMTTKNVKEDTMLSQVRGWHQLGQKSKEAITNTDLHQVADLKNYNPTRILEEPYMGPHAVNKITAWVEQVREYQRQTAGDAPVITAPPAPQQDDAPPAPRPQATVQNGEYSKLSNAAAKVGQALFVEVIEEKQGLDDELGLVSIDPHTVSHIERGRNGNDPMVHWDTNAGAQSAKVRHEMKQVYHILQVAREQGSKR
jgi:hypothetical protein